MDPSGMWVVRHLHHLGMGEQLRLLPDVLHSQPGRIGLYHLMDRHDSELVHLLCRSLQRAIARRGIVRPYAHRRIFTAIDRHFLDVRLD